MLQEMSPSRVGPAPEAIIPAFLLVPKCAWCLAEQGQPQGEGTHGICTRHAEQEYLKFRAARAARKQERH